MKISKDRQFIAVCISSKYEISKDENNESFSEFQNNVEIIIYQLLWSDDY